ncbi:MAG: AAA family ATPase [Candidatus Aminicenantes bacterium]|nr:AAA family ATPase [Candidatus Aminicenantes bacterium]MBL7083073.1 AAA family ATPase [Candidatus Aminicenantes bacterium]
MKKEVRLIGLTGTNGAGKGEAAAYFKKKGYTCFSLSDLIREELIKKGKDVTRDNLIKMGNQLREKGSPEILARLILKKIRGRAVIDSIRNPKEIDYLKKQKNFILLAIDAPVELRYKRAKKRGREESVSTLQEFIEKEAEEKTNRQKGQQLLNCIKMADFVVINDGSLENLHKKLEKLI